MTDPGYYDTSLPPSLLMGGGRRGRPAPPATAAPLPPAAPPAVVPASSDQPSSPRLVAIPGGYTTPVKATDRPRNLQELTERVDPSPATPWHAGTAVPIGISGKRAHWTGERWAGGESPGYPVTGTFVQNAPLNATPLPPAPYFPGDEQPGDLSR